MRRVATSVTRIVAHSAQIERRAMSQRSITSFFRRSEGGAGAGLSAPAAPATTTITAAPLSSFSDDSPPRKTTRKRRRISSDSDDGDAEAAPVTATSTVATPAVTSADTATPSADAVTPTAQVVTSDADALTPAPADVGYPSAQQSPKSKVLVDKQNNIQHVPVEEYSAEVSRYSAVDSACWARGAPVPYLALARALAAVERTPARLRSVAILANLLRSVLALSPRDLLPTLHLCLNRIAAPHHALELGVAESYLMKALAAATGRTLAQLKAEAARVGDLGLVAESARATQRLVRDPPRLTVRAVHAALRDIAAMSGTAAVSKKVSRIQSLLVACRDVEARFLVRSLAGKLRVGLAEQSVLLALARAVALHARPDLDGDALKARVERVSAQIRGAYCECPDLEVVVPALLEHGPDELGARVRLTPGVPLKPMLAHPTRGVRDVLTRFDGETFTCEFKYDGERAHVHVPAAAGGGVDLARAAVFSRNQENHTLKYPDVLARLPAALAPDVESCVLDCEVVAYDYDGDAILPFQVLSTRRRKETSAASVKVAVCVFMFDLLYLNGRSLVRAPLAERRALLRAHFREERGRWRFAEARDCADLDSMHECLEEAVRARCEGLMVKTLHGDRASYEIARRSRNWLKLKKDYVEGAGDSVDCVVIGGYAGRGRRAGLYGGFLLACYEPESERFQSLCKLGTGLSDEQLARAAAALAPHALPAPRPYYAVDPTHAPDAWFAPALVWEVRCADLSLSPHHRAAIGLVDPARGISLRFPRFVRERPDKKPEQATSARQVAELYRAQESAAEPASAAHDDFY